ncbi:MAG: hypothetical protein RLY93_12330 [Sumerlaeia bacterium]
MGEEKLTRDELEDVLSGLGDEGVPALVLMALTGEPILAFADATLVGGREVGSVCYFGMVENGLATEQMELFRVGAPEIYVATFRLTPRGREFAKRAADYIDMPRFVGVR